MGEVLCGCVAGCDGCREQEAREGIERLEHGWERDANLVAGKAGEGKLDNSLSRLLLI